MQARASRTVPAIMNSLTALRTAAPAAVVAVRRRAKAEEHRPSGPAPRTSPTISELLREGQEILVQISKEPLGKKGAPNNVAYRASWSISVYMPTVDHVGVSRKIASDEERSRLKRIINEHRNGLPGGFIVRTAAEGRGEDEFVQDIRFLGNLWSDIRAKSDKKSAPVLIHQRLESGARIASRSAFPGLPGHSTGQ